VQKIVYTGLRVLEHIEHAEPARADPDLVDAVKRALASLSPLERDIVSQIIYDGNSLPEIALQNGLSIGQSRAIFYEAKNRLRALLAGFVKERWGIEISGKCRVCLHPRKNEIDALLKRHSSRESWGNFNRRLEKAIGEKINPPAILINHLKHILVTLEQEENDANR
jgi:hypothetical protein